MPKDTPDPIFTPNQAIRSSSCMGVIVGAVYRPEHDKGNIVWVGWRYTLTSGQTIREDDVIAMHNWSETHNDGPGWVKVNE